MAYHLFKCPLKEMNYFYVSYINFFMELSPKSLLLKEKYN
jgi:hypothetical protein